MEPLVSIVMNCRNSAEYLREAIDSVYAQTYHNWEIIFWDNASTDNSADIAKSYDKRLRYFKGDEPVKLGKARNLAIAEAGGKYITLLDCDDKWLQEKLEKQVAALESISDIDFVYSNYFRIIMPNADKLILGLKGLQPQGYVFERFLYNYPVNIETVMLRAGAINKLGVKFDDTIELSEEYDFFMQILLRSKALYIDEPLAVYRVHRKMSSLTMMHKYPVELEYILNKFKKTDSSIESKYPSAIKYYEAKIGYWYAKSDMENNDSGAARARLGSYKSVDVKFFILYCLTFFPPAVWKWVHRYKMEGKFRWAM